MQCPHCRVPLSIAERQGIEVDYCPQCRGVWLDRGELDKIIERSARQFEAPPPPRPAPQQPQYGTPPQGGQWGEHGHYKHKKRKSFLEDVFDF
ncbi:MAG: zf-TFIIB domain-containing protein [Magnetospirillum sp.]|nr:zf-TFIIB domain-containing protein [Magnetospirillum sp.]